MKNLEKQKILIDIDDTLLKSSEEIIRELNLKNGTNKTIDNLKDYGYRSIDKNITKQDITYMYGSETFWSNIEFNDYAIDFLKKYSNIFSIIFISYGDCKNLTYKESFIYRMVAKYNLTEIGFIGCDNTINETNKSEVLLSNVYMAIDNHAGHLEQLNSPKKVLFKNGQDVTWNKVPINSDWYVVDNFKDIETMIDFDLMLKEENICIGSC